jgi:hypothetical protein
VTTSCPQCTGEMEPGKTNGSLMAGWLEERHHCARCRITVIVEYRIVADPPTQDGKQRG